eukprot:2721383-Rhodomonas_salina.1
MSMGRLFWRVRGGAGGRGAGERSNGERRKEEGWMHGGGVEEMEEEMEGERREEMDGHRSEACPSLRLGRGTQRTRSTWAWWNRPEHKSQALGPDRLGRLFVWTKLGEDVRVARAHGLEAKCLMSETCIEQQRQSGVLHPRCPGTRQLVKHSVRIGHRIPPAWDFTHSRGS